jgi:hypothetical protein
VVIAQPLASLNTYPRGKFVVLDHEGELHVILGPVNVFPYHANLIYEYLENQGRAEAVMTDGSHCRVVTHGWEVLGGGQYRLDDLTHTLHFDEKSTAYGKFPANRLDQVSDELLLALDLPGWAVDLA